MTYRIVFIVCLTLCSLHVLIAQEETVAPEYDIPAKFPYGNDSLMRFIQKNINYPPIERETALTGKVYVKFVVRESGVIDDDSVIVVRGLTPATEREAVRVVKLIPDFIPASLKGKPVKCWFTVPVVFRLQ